MIDDDDMAVGNVLQRVLQDAQSRLLFRAQTFLREIEFYKAPADLASLYGGLYPPVEKTIHLLQKLHQSINASSPLFLLIR